MTLVAVIDIFLDTQLLERQRTADAEHDLLLDAVLPVAAVELVRHAAVPFRVQLVVRVQQVQLDATHVHLPQVRIHLTAGIRNSHHERRAVRVLHLLDRQVVEVLRLVVGDLLPFRAQRLGEVAVAVEETDGGHVHVAVRRLFQVVTCQDAQTAAVDLQHVAQTVFHREICNGRAFLVWFHFHVGLELRIHAVQLCHEIGIVTQFENLVIRQGVQQHHGVAACLMPQVFVDIAEEFFPVMIPHPPEVVGQLFQFFQIFRQVGSYSHLLPSHRIHVTYFYSHNIVLLLICYFFFRYFTHIPNGSAPLAESESSEIGCKVTTFF